MGGGAVIARVSSKWKKKIFGSNRNKPKQDLFRVCFGLFRETQKFFFGLFRCIEPLPKQPKQTELFRNEPKQSRIFWKIPKYALYKNLAEQINSFWKEYWNKNKYSPKMPFLLR